MTRGNLLCGIVNDPVNSVIQIDSSIIEDATEKLVAAGLSSNFYRQSLLTQEE